MDLNVWLIFVAAFITLIECQNSSPESTNGFTEEDAWNFLRQKNKFMENATNHYVSAHWHYYTNLTKHNQYKMVAATVKYNEMFSQVSLEAKPFFEQNFTNSSLIHALDACCKYHMGDGMPKEDMEKKSTLRAKMMETYSTAEVCDKPGDATNTCYQLNPDLDNILKVSRDWDELSWLWGGWRDKTGKLMREQYKTFIDLENMYSQASGYKNMADQHMSRYKVENFEEMVANLWEEVKPLYIELHAYTRKKLKSIYGAERFPKTGHIPAHITGNMWAQRWNNIYNDVLPYPDRGMLDVTDAMIAQNYTIKRMFQTAEDFFVTLGFPLLPQEFWNNSLLEKPKDGRKVVCHASAWDFYNGSDFRIKQCTEINQMWLSTTHHEMGHIQYFMNYKNQPVYFREGANPGFHEAIGDLILLSVLNPKHLQVIGLLEERDITREDDFNYLMKMALDDVSFLPFAYVMDQWRWSVSDGRTSADHYTREWWKLRCNLQGVSSPIPRDEQDFDPGSKYHITSNTPYIRYFLATILTYQIHQSLCEVASSDGPLYHCDIYRSELAGQKLREALSMGSSKHWHEILENLTGSPHISAAPMLEYYQPLFEWLQKENAGERKGWDDECPEGMLSISTQPRGIDCNMLLILAVLVYILF